MPPLNELYDVVVVGGRVAGATLAANVAKCGMGGCVLERAEFPSDTLSTHLFQNLEGLERLGVMEQLVATGAPASAQCTMVSISPGLSDGSFENSPCCESANQGGICRDSTLVLMLRAHGRVLS